jgi:hypothetical protein
MEKDALWSHIHEEQFKKEIEAEVFEKKKKSQMGLRFFIWRMKVLSHLECEVFFCFFCKIYMNQLIINMLFFYIYIKVKFFFYPRQTFSPL